MSAKTENRNYPTRMHEVLGVEVGEVFGINDINGSFVLSPQGALLDKQDGAKMCLYIQYAINRGIIRKPRLTQEQVEHLTACVKWFDLKWLVKQRGGTTMAFEKKPHKEAIWFSGNGETEEDYGWVIKDNSEINNLVSWSDPEPLDIVQTLRDAGVVVSETESVGQDPGGEDAKEESK